MYIKKGRETVLFTYLTIIIPTYLTYLPYLTSLGKRKGKVR